MRKKRDTVSLDELITDLIYVARRIERETGGYLRFTMQFAPRESKTEVTGKAATPLDVQLEGKQR